MVTEEQRMFLLTIVTVVRNGEKVLQRLIDSVAKYKTSEVEFLIWDGKSTDRTAELVELNARVIDQYICDSDTGIYDAMNKAVKHAKGKFILFMGADDILLEDFRSVLPQLSDSSTIYYGGVITGNETVCKPYSAYQLTKENVCHQAILYPRSVFEKYEYDTRYKVFADFHLNIRCWTDPTYKQQFLNFVISEFTVGGFSGFALDLHYKRDKEAWFRTFLSTGDYLRYLNRKIGARQLIDEYLFSRRSHLVPEKNSAKHDILMIYDHQSFHSDPSYVDDTYELIKLLSSQNFDITFLMDVDFFTGQMQENLQNHHINVVKIDTDTTQIYNVVKAKADHVEFLWFLGIPENVNYRKLTANRWHIRNIFDLRGLNYTEEMNNIKKEAAIVTNSVTVAASLKSKMRVNVFDTSLEQIKILFNNLR